MMFSDATLQAHRDAQRFIQEEEMEVNGTTLSKHLYDLLLKNVSKDDPLTQDELQVRYKIQLFIYFLYQVCRYYEIFVLNFHQNNGKDGLSLLELKERN